MPFLPLDIEEMKNYGFDTPDFIIVTGDAYVDHPSFGTAIISRVLEANGYNVCIISQPQNDADFSRFGKPRFAFLVNSGNIDSMVAHYTAAKKKRSEDAYSPGGVAGRRPDRAVIVYTKALRRIFGDVAIAIGGIEASLRRFAHYDYWSDTVKPSILIDSGADLLMYGMGEKHIVEIANRLKNGENIKDLHDIKGTCYAVNIADYTANSAKECPSFELVSEPTESGKRQYAVSCRIEQEQHDAVRGKRVVQRHGDLMVIQNPPPPVLTTEEMDEIYALPFMRDYHPSYKKMGGVPAIEEVKFSVIHNRGCFGNCNFCAIAYHQGREISSRSHESVIGEVKKITEMEDFKGYIHDVGGPTANFRFSSCEKQKANGLCPDRKCLAPDICPALKVDHSDYLELLRKIRALPKVKKVFIRSGIRYDYLLADKNEEFFDELVKYHISGQLKVAPEHVSNACLKRMGKPNVEVYEEFKRKFYKKTEQIGKKQYLVPYLMSSHPGSTLNDAIELSLFLKKEGLHPEQVQDFYPTPGTVSTCMFYTGLDPFTLESVYVPKTPAEKAEQRALLQYYRPENRKLVMSALKKAKRFDLIGTGKNCLIAPDKSEKSLNNIKPKKKKKTIRNIHKPKKKQGKV
ncbi:MAG: YgiQ family radical SAM protein [Clostridia bacterium]|nr:YgiQ family radical SAM protein [Clostridia bacterium]